jgi:hypothetical protein
VREGVEGGPSLDVGAATATATSLYLGQVAYRRVDGVVNIARKGYQQPIAVGGMYA